MAFSLLLHLRSHAMSTRSDELKAKSPPPQRQSQQPGRQKQMTPAPQTIRDDYRGSDKLAGKHALISGGDSGIGRAIAVHFAREGADVAFIYLEEEEDAEETAELIGSEGVRCLKIRGDVSQPDFVRARSNRWLMNLARWKF
jgi:hypothetical protein